MTPRDRWKEIEVILNSAIPKEEAEMLIPLFKESVQFEIQKAMKIAQQDMMKKMSAM